MNTEEFKDCVSDRGQIFVNRHMQVTNQNPLSEVEGKQGMLIKEPRLYPNIFAVGDVCLTFLNEEKAILALKIMAGIVAKNIMALGHGTRLQEVPNVIPSVYGITLGPENGILIINDFVKGGP